MHLGILVSDPLLLQDFLSTFWTLHQLSCPVMDLIPVSLHMDSVVCHLREIVLCLWNYRKTHIFTLIASVRLSIRNVCHPLIEMSAFQMFPQLASSCRPDCLATMWTLKKAFFSQIHIHKKKITHPVFFQHIQKPFILLAQLTCVLDFSSSPLLRRASVMLFLLTL